MVASLSRVIAQFGLPHNRCLSSGVFFRFHSLQNLSRKMTSTHMERTVEELRSDCISDAEVIHIEDGSDTVKVLMLRVGEKSFRFKAGQWVDTLIPGLQTVGGFSMWTSPLQLRTEGTMGLAVKHSDHPPADWVHKKCKAGSRVKVRVGGDKIVFDPSPEDPTTDILLIAGGIGINPLFSILNHVHDLHACNNGNKNAYAMGKVELLYSASTPRELIFKDSIEKIVRDNDSSVFSHYFVTKSEIGEDPLKEKMLAHRISKSNVEAALRNLQKDAVRCYICGPPPMIADMEKFLSELDFDEDKIYTEKWW